MWKVVAPALLPSAYYDLLQTRRARSAGFSAHIRLGYLCSGEKSSCSPTRMADRKSTRLNSSHLVISYAVFCLKKKTRTDVIHQHDTTTLPPHPVVHAGLCS